MLSIYFLIYFLPFISKQTVSSTDTLTVYDIPTFDAGDNVEFYFLEAPMPSNTPIKLFETAGQSFNEFALIHCGFGIWNKKTGDRISIDFRPDDVIYSLLPYIDPNTGIMTWNNTGSIVVTWPINDTAWTNSRQIADSNGAAVSGLREWLIDAQSSFTRFQPVTVMNLSGSQQSVMWNQPPNIVYEAYDANSLVQGILNELAEELNINLQCFTPVFTTYFTYNSDETMVSLSDPIPITNEVVIAWYSELWDCYQKQFDAANDGPTGNITGGFAFFELLTLCYTSSVAYVYASPSTVQNVSLTANGQTPSLIRYEFVLPEAPNMKLELGATDYIVVILLLGSVFGGIGYLVYRINSKPQERHKLRVTNSTVIRSGAFSSMLGGIGGTPTLSRVIFGSKDVERDTGSSMARHSSAGSTGSVRMEDVPGVVISPFKGGYVCSTEKPRRAVIPPEHAGPMVHGINSKSTDVREGAYSNFNTSPKMSRDRPGDSSVM